MQHTLKAPGPVCEGFSFTKSECSNLKKGMKPREAEKAVSCLLAKSNTEDICAYNVVSVCALEGVARACIDSATDKSCQAVMQKCKGQRWSKVTMTSCQAALSSVTDKNRPRLVSCIQEGCDVENCFYNLK